MPVCMERRTVGARLLRAIAVLIAISALVTRADSAAASGRVALVIGNGAYGAAGALANPANDARDMAASLREMGFDVLLRIDATRAEMADAIGQYTERARGAELALFFYAGHGAQLNGENYLLPVDAAVENEADLKLNAIDLSSLQDALPEAHANVIILDACRNNPFAGTIAGHRGIGASRGLTPMDPKTGSEIVFATKPNSVAADGSGRNSPFTAALLRHIGARGLEIRQMISRVRRDVIDATNGEQVPWDNSSLVDDLYLAGMESTSPSFAAVPPIAPAPAPAPQDPCATASLDDYATPIRNVFTALTQRDLALYADQWADDAIYHNSRTGEIRAKEQIVGAKRQAFARWSRVGVEVRGPVLISRSERNAVLEDEYTLTVVSGGRSLPADSGRERYSVRCDPSGRWTIVRNDDYLK